MTERSVRRVDELLSELVELVETSRAVPMSGSCVVPRERTLDLLDELRDTIPAELTEARRLLSQRETLLGEADEIHRQAAERAASEAESVLAEAREHANGLVADAEVRAHETVEAGNAEHAELVSASGVHHSATEVAAERQAEADAYHAQVRGEADTYHAERRARADEYSAAMRTDAESFADRTLADLVAVLRQAMQTAEQGRQALAQGGEDAEPSTQQSLSS